jgi:serine/threonine protein kinase
MPNSVQIDELLHRWETARRRGIVVDVAELCADCPHLVDELRIRIGSLMAMEQILGVADLDPPNLQTLIEGAQVRTEPEPLPKIDGYDLIRIIDRGGMGIVFEARQFKLGRTVAIKMISGDYLRPKLAARFRAEAEAAARLQHPNFVQVFEVGQIQGRPFFSMEYVSGGSLADRLSRQPLAPRETAELVETLARAVHAAHERGIVHRDLKPANIMLTADGTPKITDFGLAKLIDDDSGFTHTGEILGTPSYMAPEQAEGKKDQIGPHTDVYALGAILYELLAGKPPFQGASPIDSLRLVISQEPIAPSRLAPATPRDLESICLKCLEKHPAQRYRSAQALAEDLHRFLSGHPVIARRIGPPQRIWKWIRRHPQGVALYSLIGLLGLIPISVMFGNYRADAQLRRKAEEQAPLVHEILQRNCWECHGQNPRDVKKNLNILNHQQLLDSTRRIVVPGSPDNSRLIQRIADGSMPPEEDEEHLPRVTEAELTILRDWILGGAPPLPPDDPDQPTPPVVPYSEVAVEAKKILHQHCYECHKYDVAKGGIKILHHRLLVTVRKVVLPGDPENSELMHVLTTPDEELRMPQPPTERLSADDIAVIRRWIADGAPPFPKEK